MASSFSQSSNWSTSFERNQSYKHPQTGKLTQSQKPATVLIKQNVKLAKKLQLTNVEKHKYVQRLKTQASNEQCSSLYDKDILHYEEKVVTLVKDGELESAVNLFKKFGFYSLSPSRRTYSILVACYCKLNEVNEAKRVLDLMVENGVHPNIATFTVLIDTMCRKGKLQKAYEVFEVMRSVGCKPTIWTYNCLLKGLCYVGRVEEAFELLRTIKRMDRKPDIYTYTCVMDGFCKVGRTDEGMELLEEALEIGLEPNVISYNTLFDGYSREGRPLEGIKVLKRMKENGCPSDYVSCTTLLHGLLKWEEFLAAFKVYKEMLDDGFEVSEKLMNTLFKGVCRRSWSDAELLIDVEEVFERIKVGSVPFPYTYCMVIQALSIRGETDKAIANLHEMLRIGYFPRMVTVNDVTRALCSEGNVDRALYVLVLLNSFEFIPSAFSFNLLIYHFRKLGRLLDAFAVYGAALKQGIVP